MRMTILKNFKPVKIKKEHLVLAGLFMLPGGSIVVLGALVYKIMGKKK